MGYKFHFFHFIAQNTVLRFANLIRVCITNSWNVFKISKSFDLSTKSSSLKKKFYIWFEVFVLGYNIFLDDSYTEKFQTHVCITKLWGRLWPISYEIPIMTQTAPKKMSFEFTYFLVIRFILTIHLRIEKKLSL